MVSQSRAIPVLITRPEPQASRFRQTLLDRYGDKVDPILSPLLCPVVMPTQVECGAFSSVVFTSETGVKAARTLGLSLPRRAYCVGNRTAEVARELGFESISANGASGDLAQMLANHPEDSPFLHLHGRESVGDVAQALADRGVKAESRVIYAQEPIPFNETVKFTLQSVGPVIVPLFSPRSARLFGAACAVLTLRATLYLVVLSPAVTQAVADMKVQQVKVAAAPTQKDLLLAMDHCFLNA
ncbi:MAG: uroporphyrinogen-III synthase [Rhodobacteraceae bacterium]|nr:uroporphyrinogen-III synthase [Paracoccaceae bacterium]